MIKNCVLLFHDAKVTTFFVMAKLFSLKNVSFLVFNANNRARVPFSIRLRMHDSIA